MAAHAAFSHSSQGHAAPFSMNIGSNLTQQQIANDENAERLRHLWEALLHLVRTLEQAEIQTQTERQKQRQSERQNERVRETERQETERQRQAGRRVRGSEAERGRDRDCVYAVRCCASAGVCCMTVFDVQQTSMLRFGAPFGEHLLGLRYNHAVRLLLYLSVFSLTVCSISVSLSFRVTCSLLSLLCDVCLLITPDALSRASLRHGSTCSGLCLLPTHVFLTSHTSFSSSSSSSFADVILDVMSVLGGRHPDLARLSAVISRVRKVASVLVLFRFVSSGSPLRLADTLFRKNLVSTRTNFKGKYVLFARFDVLFSYFCLFF